MKLLAFAFAALLLLGGATAARADDASALLHKHKTFTGWQFADKETNFAQVTDTTLDGAGKPVEIATVKRIGALYRTDTQNLKAGTTSSGGFTGNLFWYSDENGFTVPVIGDPAKVQLAEDLFFTDGFAQLPWTFLRSEKRWNKTYDVVGAKQASSTPVELFVDPETGEYGGVTIDPKGDNEETIQVVDYQTIDGKHFINHWKFDDSKRTHAFSDIKLGIALTGADLHPPAQTAHWDFKNTDPFPVKLTKDRIIIKVKVNGVEGTFLLDSGASNIYLSGAFARRAGIKAQGHSQAFTLYGTEKTDAGRADTLEIGGNVLHDVNLYFGSADIEDDAPDGLMGFDLLAGALVSVDFEKATLQLRDPAVTNANDLDGVHVGVDLSSGQPVTPMSVQDKSATVNALLDTGSPRVILISEDLPGRYGLHMTSAGVLGGCGTLDNMKLGPIVYDTPNACTVDGWPLHSALLGYDFLKGLGKLHFDYSHAALVLVPRKQ